MNNFSKLINYLLFSGLLLSQSNESMSSTPSLIPFQLSHTSKPLLHLGGIEENKQIRFLSSLQFPLSSNLLIGGLLSPHKIESDLSIYYHIAIGYIPKWKLLKISSNMLQIGLHRDEYADGGNKRWFSFSIMDSNQFGNLNLNFCWNRLFTKNQKKDTLVISSDIKINNNVYIRPGALAYFRPEFDYSPFLLISIKL